MEDITKATAIQLERGMGSLKTTLDKNAPVKIPSEDETTE